MDIQETIKKVNRLRELKAKFILGSITDTERRELVVIEGFATEEEVHHQKAEADKANEERKAGYGTFRLK